MPLSSRRRRRDRHNSARPTKCPVDFEHFQLMMYPDMPTILKMCNEAGKLLPPVDPTPSPPSDSPPILTADETWKRRASLRKPKKKLARSGFNLKANPDKCVKVKYTIKNGIVCVANPIASYRPASAKVPQGRDDPLQHLAYQNPCTPSCTAMGHLDDEEWQSHMRFIEKIEPKKKTKEIDRCLVRISPGPINDTVWGPLSLYKYYKEGIGEKPKASRAVQTNQLTSIPLQEEKFTDFEKHQTATAHVTESNIPLPPIKNDLYIKGEIDEYYDMPILIPELPINCLEDPFENDEEEKPLV